MIAANILFAHQADRGPCSACYRGHVLKCDHIQCVFHRHVPLWEKVIMLTMALLGAVVGITSTGMTMKQIIQHGLDSSCLINIRATNTNTTQ